MIKDTELRKGNLLYVGDKNIISEVTVIGEDYLGTTKTLGFINIELFSPIPLTPEILEKCGFTKANEEGVTTFTLEISKENIAPHSDNEYKLFGIKAKGTNSIQIDYTVNRYWAAKSIHYLHELQNLYLWITGEELPIKL